MSMKTSQILKFTDSWETQKSKYLENKSNFFIWKKNHSLHIKGYIMAKNSHLKKDLDN